MNRAVLLPTILATLLAAGCAGARVDTAEMPAGEFTFSDVDQAALYEASHAFGTGGTVPATVHDRARALADVEYVSGAYNTHARWIGIDGLAQADLLIARREMRASLGIPAQARSQAVVNGLLAISHATDAASLQAAAGNPVFPEGPQSTIAALQNLPSYFTMPYALARANIAIQEKDGTCNRLFC